MATKYKSKKPANASPAPDWGGDDADEGASIATTQAPAAPSNATPETQGAQVGQASEPPPPPQGDTVNIKGSDVDGNLAKIADVIADGIALMKATQPQQDSGPKLPSKEELPTDFGEALELLKDAENLPQKTKAQILFKEGALKLIRGHVFEMQQGNPQVILTADHIAAAPGLNSKSIQEERIELRARSDQDISFLLEQISLLKKQIADQTKK